MPDSPVNTLTDTRERLLHAAILVFTEQGYAGATTRRIAAVAEVSEVTLFRHFGNKLTLMTTAIEVISGNHSVKQMMEEELTGDIIPDLRRLSAHILMLVKRKHDVMRLMVEVHQIPELYEKLLENAAERRAWFTEFFQHQVELGALRESVTPETLTLSFMGLIMGYGMSAQIHHDTPEDTNRQIDALIDVFLHGTSA